MKDKKQLSIEEIQELLDVATAELFNFFTREQIITINNLTSKYTLEDTCSFVEINLRAKTVRNTLFENINLN